MTVREESWMTFTIYHFLDDGFGTTGPSYYERMGAIMIKQSELSNEGTNVERMMTDLDYIWCIGNGECLRESDALLVTAYRAFAHRSLMTGDLIVVGEAVWRIMPIGFELAPEMQYLLEGNNILRSCV